MSYSKVSADCCTDDKADRFCVVYNMLSEPEQEEVRDILGENCDDGKRVKIKSQNVRLVAVTKAMSKRKPNFLRFGRSVEDKPTFLRFGRASDTPNFLRFGRSNQSPHFLRFGTDT